jgi:F-type H+-transporting ATPase subunit b
MRRRPAASDGWRDLALVALTVLGGAAPAWAEEGKGGMDFGDVGQAIAAMLIFLILLAVLGKWAWKPIATQLRLREQEIADAMARSQKRENESQELLAQYKARLDRADADAQEVLARTRKEAAEVRQSILTTAHDESRKFAEQARQEIEQAKQSAMNELYDVTASLATEMAGKIIHKNLTPEDQGALLQESLEDIRRRASGKA